VRAPKGRRASRALGGGQFVVWVDLLLEVGEEGSSGVGGELTAVVAGMDGEAADTAA
jgi:hypothetical protein